MKLNEGFNKVKTNARALDVFTVCVNLIETCEDILFLIVRNTDTGINNIDKEGYVAASLEICLWFKVNADGYAAVFRCIF